MTGGPAPEPVFALRGPLKLLGSLFAPAMIFMMMSMAYASALLETVRVGLPSPCGAPTASSSDVPSESATFAVLGSYSPIVIFDLCAREDPVSLDRNSMLHYLPSTADQDGPAIPPVTTDLFKKSTICPIKSISIVDYSK